MASDVVLASSKAPTKSAFTLLDLTEAGHGSRSFLYREMRSGRLRAVKRGDRTIILAEDLQNWIESLPAAKFETAA